MRPLAAGRRSGLIIASDTFDDPQLRQLRAPGTDALELAAVLRDPDIGGFDLRLAMNQRYYEVRIALEDFFDDRRPDDVLLLHFSCHGLKDEAGRLFFAVSDTQKQRLNATGISAEYVKDLLDRTRSRRVVLLLDCCFSGAFTRGMLARGDTSLDVQERFHGRGRAVLTASSALEYAWEGETLARLNEPSIFTGAVVRGLRSGDADRDGDQLVSVDDLYDYVFDEVRRTTSNQTPGKWSNVEGALFIAHRPGRRSQAPVAEPARAAPPPTEPAPAARVPAERSQAAPSTPTQPRASAGAAPTGAAWLPTALVPGAWIATWLVAFALASSKSVPDMTYASALAIIAWVVGAPMAALALYFSAPNVSRRRALLLAVGWPVCMLFGLAGPFMLRLSTAGAGLLGVSVAVAGLIAAVAIAPADRPIAWGRVLLVTGGWCLGWLWSGTVAWPIAFWLVADRYVNTFDAIMGSVPFVNLAAGPVLSGIAGGVLGYVLQRRRLA